MGKHYSSGTNTLLLPMRMAAIPTSDNSFCNLSRIGDLNTTSWHVLAYLVDFLTTISMCTEIPEKHFFPVSEASPALCIDFGTPKPCIPWAK
jgi:hypothetical protein